jgi:hypothetical protein
MSAELELAVRAILVGTGATVLLDLWALLLDRCFGVPAPNIRLVGRWVGHMMRGRFAHASIAATAPIRAERGLGWIVHYATGIGFAFALLAVWGLEWARNPTLPPALIVGVLTVLLPFFLMQPAMGAGIAAAKTPNPNRARLRSLATHTVFGVGLYVAALATMLVVAP